jgi:hypothetical protein
MEMNDVNLNNFRNDFAKAMEELEKKYGVKVEMGRISYNEHEFSTKLNVTNATNDEELEKTKFMNAIAPFANYGLYADDYKKEFKIQGKTYQLIGVKPRARKNPLIIKDKEGKTYCCAPEALGLTYSRFITRPVEVSL